MKINKGITDLHSFRVAGGKARWANIKLEQRSKIMKKVRKGGKPKISKIVEDMEKRMYERAVGERIKQ